ncbi:L-threonylcarbamoyladenylate synthase [Acidithiobacillus ferriphilus]|jgi:translation factor SUA5|uniref:L-threonylcarbamoyladenylate synthase n=2 Tax=Acidithiobacillus TaxID=119977 RepID=A0A257T9N1_9PROT|nr:MULTISPECIES: Sua5/YciO/YrdC/YwlC family protein [Acidithiobacillus]OYV82238.1 MAG: translation factor Sua5 [Acidithiobacillus ferrivorans]MBU2828293.1 Sua5/YciO/YrdC/YwlC family protein [Acidithiobacillus ferriphilus]MBU2846028.1 Sua5/YciO/YrdC/YwlC family protein [Acidithiobacillus ferriphilus]MBU2849196.1 Sua5/YciO/YrdC/YwlC family protein [Acidithiobacillus ferriphilus]MDA8246409.1 Sua5/YciO/YrdC/YwlC family protein [Acidithiobacillus sp.]
MLPRHPRRQDIRRGIAHLRRGGVIAYPTEGVWGLGCDPRQRRALRRVLVLKRRPQHKGVLLVAGRVAETRRYWSAQGIDPALPAQLWPGTTLVLPATPKVPFWIRGRHESIAVRISTHPAIVALSHAFGGAIVSTSANPAGQQPARDLRTLYRYFGRSLWILPARLGRQRRPSRIVDARSGRILRE